MKSLATIVCEVAAGIGLDPYVESDDADGSAAYVGEFMIKRDDGEVGVYRITSIPGGQSADPVRSPIPCDDVNAEARAAIALLRAWVNRSLDFAELAATQPEE